ncbi:MAG: J domain-containing protein [Arenimonas sp.]|nr:J domain-containing protein [Arenimonas sp.]MBP7917419.1 J domain-containing protein [Arenimonas sp.]
MSIETHYDTLRVARDAPSDAIRSAYKSLIQKSNADHNPRADASRSMKAIHDAYAVLSNPVQRAEYDRLLLERESALVGKGSTDGMEVRGKTSWRWLLYMAAGAALLAVVGWLGLANVAVENRTASTPQTDGTATQQGLSSQKSSVQNDAVAGIPGEPIATHMVVANSIPEHDKVALDAFIGAWKGDNGGLGSQQTLDILSKSGHSFVFRLDSKAGQGIGGVYGIAEFDNSFGHFFNKEYDCSILFTIKSGVLQLNTDSCQEYHETGVSFDGTYVKPEPAGAIGKPPPVKPKTTKPKSTSGSEPTPQQTGPAPAAAVNAPKLRKFSATVKDSDGNVNTFELIAKDKNAARAIIRDFRGNPKIMKLKELKK